MIFPSSPVFFILFFCRVTIRAFSLSARLHSRLFDDIPSFFKGWKCQYIFFQLPYPPSYPIGFFSRFLPQPELPQGYKFEEP